MIEIATFLRFVELFCQRTWQDNVRESKVPNTLWSLQFIIRESIFYDSSEYSENVENIFIRIMISNHHGDIWM